MKKAFLFFLLLAACNSKEAVTSLSPADFNSMLKDSPGAILLDVRTEQEVKEGALKGARNIVYDDSFANKLEVLSRETPVFVYCAKGKRSEKAAAILKEKGFKEVYQLSGGLEAWKQANLPL